MVVPQKIKNRTITQFSNSASGYLSEENKTVTQEDICTPMFIEHYTQKPRCESNPSVCQQMNG